MAGSYEHLVFNAFTYAHKARISSLVTRLLILLKANIAVKFMRYMVSRKRYAS